MAVWPFNRKKTSPVDDQVPEEVREYYESGKKRTAMAWLLAFATLVVTVLLALFIFFAGRWVYRQFINEDEPQAPTTQQTETENETEQPAEETPKTTTTTPNTQQGTSSSSSTQTPSSTPAASSPTTGPTATEVPNTGPGPEGLQ